MTLESLPYHQPFFRRWRSLVILFYLVTRIVFAAESRVFSWEQQTIGHPVSTQPSYFNSPPEPVGSHSTIVIREPMTSTTGYSRLFDDNAHEISLAATRNMTISQDSKTILSLGQQQIHPPKWDFSFPRCQSFNRSQPPTIETPRHDPSEPWSTGCYRRSEYEVGRIRSDFRNFYSRENFANILVGFGIHATISNTCLDQELIDWYQRDVRSRGLNRFSDGVRDFGSQVAIAPFVVISILYYSDKITDRVRFYETQGGSWLGEFATRTTRGFLVGTPTLLFSQLLIGARRPNDPSPTSRWQPFRDDHGVSGHAFVGAMPFITLAQMSDNFWLKAGFYTCSTFTAWSRVNDQAHYFSQALVGWYLAYLSCRAVSKTEYQLLPRGLTVFPIVESRTTGIGFVYQW